MKFLKVAIDKDRDAAVSSFERQCGKTKDYNMKLIVSKMAFITTAERMLVWIGNLKNIPQANHPQKKRITTWVSYYCKKLTMS